MVMWADRLVLRLQARLLKRRIAKVKARLVREGVL